ncbi:MAG: metallophosphoesterase [Desulfobulbaceae bacterium]|nr:metallophosphoesterase [Desulfobulbaceae bacterium]
MRIIAFGDIHMSLGNIRNLPDIKNADLVVVTGDLTNYGGKKDAKIILDQLLSLNKKLIALPGNLDEPEVDKYLTDINLNLHGRGKVINGIGIMGMGGSNITPFNTPGEYSEEELARLLNIGYEAIKSAGRIILVSHAPPLNTETDRISAGAHVGSVAVRNFIEKVQPEVCLTGHIHEARAEDKIGKTHILNPGMIKDGGWIEVLLENGKITASIKMI